MRSAHFRTRWLVRGTIKDDLKIGSGLWNGWFSAVQSANVKVIPTIAWFDAGGIYNLLSVTSTRQAAEDSIAALVKTQNFDGIDIDFEGMSPATRPYYSLFIQGFGKSSSSGQGKLTCTVVPRTPPSSIYVVVPANIVYPENYTVLNQYCDEVRLMAYDQETVDLKLDASKGGGWNALRADGGSGLGDEDRAVCVAIHQPEKDHVGHSDIRV